MIGSLDVTALYPSIRRREAAKIIREEVASSELKFEGINYRQALIYCKLTMKTVDIVDAKVQGILPRKLNRQGNKATILSAGTDDVRERWWYPTKPEDLTEDQRKTVMACVIEQMVLAVFSSHFYEWNCQIYWP